MTEEEAKKKICPIFTINYSIITTSSLKLGLREADNKEAIDTARKTLFCIASQCMLWRWKAFIEASDKEKWGEKKDFNGYCGLGGKNEKT